MERGNLHVYGLTKTKIYDYEDKFNINFQSICFLNMHTEINK